jgi:hypothetical protein
MSSQAGRYLSGEENRGWEAEASAVVVGVPDRALTPGAGMAAATGLCDKLGVIGALDAAVGPVKERAHGFGAGELLIGMASAQLAGEDFAGPAHTPHGSARCNRPGTRLTPAAPYW